MAKQKPLSKRAKARLARMRRDPFGRLTLEIQRYLKTVRWEAVVMGTPKISGFEKPGVGNYEFSVSFTGWRLEPKPSSSLRRRG